MKLLTFFKGDRLALGVKTGTGVIDIEAVVQRFSAADVPTDIMEVIAGGREAVDRLAKVVDKAESSPDPSYVLDEGRLEWGPCVTRPNKIICVGMNYYRHVAETNGKVPDYPILFAKYNNTLTAHKRDIPIPKATQKLDYEVELCIVIGKRSKYVSREDALGHVFGYCVVNDLSARDLQFRTVQWLTGKSCDGFTPLGPYLVTADEVGNPSGLNLKTVVNGEVRQNSNTSDMIFPCDAIVSYISQLMTLVPGDLILTGTPEGVVLGYPPEKQVYLKPGDVVTVEIEKLGALTNRFVEEK